MGRIRQAVLGGPTRLGFWTLPVFLIVGLAGAVIAGSLAVVYYSQQVRDLRDETASVREEAADTVAEIRSVGDEALADIEEQVAAVEESLSVDLPVEDVTALGVVMIRATRNAQAPSPAPGPTEVPTTQSTPPPAGDDGSTTGPSGGQTPAGAPVPIEVAPQTEPTSSPSPTSTASPTAPPTGTPTPTVSPSPSPDPLPRVPQLGMGFAVAVADGSTFFATSYGLVADPRTAAGVVEEVEVITTEGTFAATVHDWDEARDLAIVRSRFTGPPVTRLRPRGDRVEVGERLWLVGITATRVQAQLELTIGYATETELLVDLGRKDQFRGAPIVDRDGRVTAIYTPDYQPFGAEAGEGQAVLPVAVLCERLLSGCESLEVERDEEP